MLPEAEALGSKIDGTLSVGEFSTPRESTPRATTAGTPPRRTPSPTRTAEPAAESEAEPEETISAVPVTDTEIPTPLAHGDEDIGLFEAGNLEDEPTETEPAIVQRVSASGYMFVAKINDVFEDGLEEQLCRVLQINRDMCVTQTSNTPCDGRHDGRHVSGRKTVYLGTLDRRIDADELKKVVINGVHLNGDTVKGFALDSVLAGPADGTSREVLREALASGVSSIPQSPPLTEDGSGIQSQRLSELEETTAVFRDIFQKMFIKPTSGLQSPLSVVMIDHHQKDMATVSRKCRDSATNCLIRTKMGARYCVLPRWISAILTLVVATALVVGVLWKVTDEAAALWNGDSGLTFRTNLLSFAADSQDFFLGMGYRIPQLDSLGDFVCSCVDSDVEKCFEQKIPFKVCCHPHPAGQVGLNLEPEGYCCENDLLAPFDASPADFCVRGQGNTTVFEPVEGPVEAELEAETLFSTAGAVGSVLSDVILTLLFSVYLL